MSKLFNASDFEALIVEQGFTVMTATRERTRDYVHIQAVHNDELECKIELNAWFPAREAE